MSKDTILKQHLEFKKTSVHSKSKLQDIERYMSRFINSSNKPLSKFEEKDIVKFLNSLDFSIRTLNGIKTDIKVFIRWYYPDYSSRFRNLNKICSQQKPQRAYEPEQMLSIEDLEKLVKTEKDLMWKVYWLVFFYGGFRPSEACRLKWSQVYFEPKGVVIKLHTTKTNKDFYKSLPSNAEHLLKEWKTHNDSEFVFPSPVTDSYIQSRSVRSRLRTLSKNALNRKVVPYQLRHSIATILYKDDKRKDDETANQLGHTKSMKQVYMNLSEEDLKARARSLWTKTKPLTTKEQDQLKIFQKQMQTNRELIQLIISAIKNPKKNDLEIINKKIIEFNKEIP